MVLLAGDARDHLPCLAPEVVLIDPMHPDRGNTALVKQDMRRLRAIVGPDIDAGALLACALASTARRVVLKWPLHAAPLAGAPARSHAIMGKTTRYDVFRAALTPAASDTISARHDRGRS